MVDDERVVGFDNAAKRLWQANERTNHDNDDGDCHCVVHKNLCEFLRLVQLGLARCSSGWIDGCVGGKTWHPYVHATHAQCAAHVARAPLVRQHYDGYFRFLKYDR